MDKTAEKNRWSWLPTAMPGVTRLIADKRKEYGAAWVSTCWSKSIAGEPGWFFAREGPLTVGTPFDDPTCVNFAAEHVLSTEALVLMRKPEAGHGANP